MFECDGDELKEGIDEGRVHVDDAVAMLLGHAVDGFDVGVVVGIG